TAAESGQVGADALALVVEAMAFDALRFLGVLEDLPAAFGIAGARQRGACEALVLRRGAQAAETQRKLRTFFAARQLHQPLIVALIQRGFDPVRVRTRARLGAVVDRLAVEPDL